MPANSLSIEEREFTKFNATEQSGRIDIAGEYTVTVSNTGILPAPGTTLTVSSMETPNSGVELISQETATVGTISGGQKSEASIKFNASASQSDLAQFATSGCNNGTATVSIQESISGILLAVGFQDSFDVASSSPNCSLGSENGSGTPPDDPGTPPDDPGNGGGNRNPPGGEDPEVQTVNINGPSEPTVGEPASYTVTGEPSTASSYIWANSADEFDQGSSRDDTAEYIFDEPERHRIVVDVRDDVGRLVGEGETIVDIQPEEDSGTGGGGGRDDPPEDGGGGSDGPDTSGEIDGPTTVVVDETNTWEWTGQQNWDDRIYSLHWSMSEGDGFDYEGRFTRTSVNHAYDFQGPKTITFQVQRQDDDSVVLEDTYNVEVLNPATGGLSADSGIPSMDEAADMKNRGGF